MTELSPAAQAVDTALADCIQLQGEIIRACPLAAAALEAVADQVVPNEPWHARLPTDHHGWYSRQRYMTRAELLAIAAELRGNTTKETS